MNTGKLTKPFRRLGLMHLLDKLKFYYQRWENNKINKIFKKEHPTVILPPDYMMFEAFQVNYEKYFYGGQKSAVWVKEWLEQFIDLRNKKILDWGCGPSRILRHMPKVINQGCQFFGTDYNKETIRWCRSNIKGIHFRENEITPPLDFESDFFDAIYGLSIFTHLSELNHIKWYEELIRVSKQGGILMLSTQGEAYKEKLTSVEEKQFEQGKIIVRGNVIEGHRVFSAFHPIEYIRDLFGTKAEILAHKPGEKKLWGIEQDIWIIRKK